MLKLATLLCAALLMLAGLVSALDDQALEDLKYNLDLWTIIIFLLIINLVSFLSFILMYLGYRWVKKDLDKPSSLPDKNSEN